MTKSIIKRPDRKYHLILLYNDSLNLYMNCISSMFDNNVLTESLSFFCNVFYHHTRRKYQDSFVFLLKVNYFSGCNTWVQLEFTCIKRSLQNSDLLGYSEVHFFKIKIKRNTTFRFLFYLVKSSLDSPQKKRTPNPSIEFCKNSVPSYLGFILTPKK